MYKEERGVLHVVCPRSTARAHRNKDLVTSVPAKWAPSGTPLRPRDALSQATFFFCFGKKIFSVFSYH
jgi:hypothetical protein